MVGVEVQNSEERAAFLCASGVFENWKIVIWSWKMSEARLACHVVVLSSSAGERLLEQRWHLANPPTPFLAQAAMDRC